APAHVHELRKDRLLRLRHKGTNRSRARVQTSHYPLAEPGENWSWCYLDEVAFVLRTGDEAVLVQVELPLASSDVVARDLEAPLAGEHALVVFPDGEVGLDAEAGRVTREVGPGADLRAPDSAGDRDLVFAVRTRRERLSLDDRERTRRSVLVLEA